MLQVLISILLLSNFEQKYLNILFERKSFFLLYLNSLVINFKGFRIYSAYHAIDDIIDNHFSKDLSSAKVIKYIDNSNNQ